MLSEDEVFKMYEQGYTIAYIAKKYMHCRNISAMHYPRKIGRKEARYIVERIIYYNLPKRKKRK